jgi:hypothetical protein
MFFDPDVCGGKQCCPGFTMRGLPKLLMLSFPSQNVDGLLSIECIFERRGFNRERIALKLEKTDNILSRVAFIPRHINMGHNFIVSDLISAGVGKHVFMKINPVFVDFRRASFLVHNQNHHAAFGREDDVAYRVLAQEGRRLPRCQVLEDIRDQIPIADKIGVRSL